MRMDSGTDFGLVPPINGLGIHCVDIFYKYFVPTGLTEAEAKQGTILRQLNKSLDQSLLHCRANLKSVPI